MKFSSFRRIVFFPPFSTQVPNPLLFDELDTWNEIVIVPPNSSHLIPPNSAERKNPSRGGSMRSRVEAPQKIYFLDLLKLQFSTRRRRYSTSFVSGRRVEESRSLGADGI